MCFSSARLVGLVMAGGLAFAGCGSGDSDGGTSSKHKIGGTVSGLVGAGLVLNSSICGDLPVAVNGPFTFPTEAENGAEYLITVKTQPSATELCSVAPQSGTVGGSDVTVTVTCSSSSQTYTVGGAVSGVTASGLVLQNNLGPDLPVTAAATSFTFPDHVADGGGYSVTVKSPASGMSCQVASGSGTIHSANVTNVAVTCTPGPTAVVQRWEAPSTTGVVQAYTRDREALSIGSNGSVHILGRNEPRIDATKGFLFGLQGGNRLNSNGAVSEAFNLWAPAGGATVQADASQAPVDGGGQTADTVTLPAGASLSTAIGAHHGRDLPWGAETPGPFLGQIWIRPTTTSGTLRFSTSNPPSEVSISLSTLNPNAWNHVPLTGLRTDGYAGTFTMTATAGSVTFGAWGANLMQLCNGGDPGSFHLDPAIYDRSGSQIPSDVLDLETAVPQSTATTGFCLSVDAQPYDGLGWNTPLVFKRGLMGWFASGSTQSTTSLYLTGTHASGGAGRLCFYVGAHTGDVVCAAVPAGWSPGTKHNVKGCLSASDGNLRLYADDQAIGTPVALSAGRVIPDLLGGHLVIGNTSEADFDSAWAPDPSVPWNGYISKVVACLEGAERATMCR
jgi:hypothetical protein